MRRLQAEAAAEEEADGVRVKAKAGFTGGLKEIEDAMPKQLNYDERVTTLWESSDVPDFVPEEGSAEAEKYAELMKIQFAEGIRGSQHDGDDVAEQDARRNPEMQIEADPTLVYMPDEEDCDAECRLDAFGERDFVLPEPRFNVQTMTETPFDDEFEMFTIGNDAKTLTIDVPPVAMAFEDFY